MNKDDQTTRHEKWRELVKEQEASGLSQAQFRKERNISSAKLGHCEATPDQPPNV